eukprot:1146058-Rhodomonas_salina.3
MCAASLLAAGFHLPTALLLPRSARPSSIPPVRPPRRRVGSDDFRAQFRGRAADSGTDFALFRQDAPACTGAHALTAFFSYRNSVRKADTLLASS